MKRMFLAVVVILIVQSAVYGQAWPLKPVRVIVSVGAGSSTDIVHRLFLEQLSATLGQSIVVDNRTGAGGTIGTAVAARAQPDGYTLLASGKAQTIAPALYKHLPYDTARDFVPVVPLGISPSVLVVSPARGIKTARALVSAAKARPGVLNFSSVGVGTATHLSAERFASSAGIEVVHVPFKGGTEAMLEVIAGRGDFFFGPVALVLPHIRDGRLVALAVNSMKRSPMLADVPTLQEAGYPRAEFPIWYGLFAPTKTPRDIVEKLHQESRRVLQTPRLREKLSGLGVEPLDLTLEEFKHYVEGEFALNTALARTAGVKAP